MSNPGKKKIPPDPECMNDQRAEWADIALKAFLAACPDDEEAALRDLLCNLRHWADRHDVDFDLKLRTSTGCYEEEISPYPSDVSELEVDSDEDEILFIVPVSQILK